MALIADILLGAGAVAAALYCLVLSRRLQRFTRLEDGMGAAIAVLSAQVDDMTRALKQAQTAAQTSGATLITQTARAELAAERLSLMLAAMHDLPEPSVQMPPKPSHRDPEPEKVHDTVQDPESGPEHDPEPEAREPERRLRFVRRRPAQGVPEAAE